MIYLYQIHLQSWRECDGMTWYRILADMTEKPEVFHGWKLVRVELRTLLALEVI